MNEIDTKVYVMSKTFDKVIDYLDIDDCISLYNLQRYEYTINEAVILGGYVNTDEYKLFIPSAQFAYDNWEEYVLITLKNSIRNYNINKI